MLINFFHGLRDAGVPVTTRELLDLMEGMKQHIVFGSIDEFYYFSRTCMVKDEKYFDRFDRAFGADEPRATRLVVIGQQGIDQAAITSALESAAGA